MRFPCRLKAEDTFSEIAPLSEPIFAVLFDVDQDLDVYVALRNEVSQKRPGAVNESVLWTDTRGSIASEGELRSSKSQQR